MGKQILGKNGNGNDVMTWEWVGMGMGMMLWEWEGAGTLKLILAHLYSSALVLMHLTCARLHACLRKILRIPYTCHVTNVEVRTTTSCHPPSHLVTDRRLRLFGHIARSSPQEDHHRAVAAVIRGLPSDWKRPLGRPSYTWLRAVEADLGQQDIGLASAWRKAAIRDDWRRIVDTATIQWSSMP